MMLVGIRSTVLMAIRIEVATARGPISGTCVAELVDMEAMLTFGQVADLARDVDEPVFLDESDLAKGLVAFRATNSTNSAVGNQVLVSAFLGVIGLYRDQHGSGRTEHQAK